MKIEPMKWRFCKAVACDELDGMECKAKECTKPDTVKALDERRTQLKAVKDGR